jgi:hypothetical protein
MKRRAAHPPNGLGVCHRPVVKLKKALRTAFLVAPRTEPRAQMPRRSCKDDPGHLPWVGHVSSASPQDRLNAPSLKKHETLLRKS